MSSEQPEGETGADPRGGRCREGARAAALRVIERHGEQVMRTARRYAPSPDDAEDAYQRGVEIMLLKAPDIPDEELVAWLKTVVKHEAFAIRRQNERVAVGFDAADGEAGGEAAIVSPAASPAEQLERFERLRLGAEAMQQLKPQEVRALRLVAQGYSYRQICDLTGWTYTKVNRCLAEGRQSFLRRVKGIESGAECARLEPKLSALADGEARGEDLAIVRRHLRGCAACRATLREHHLAPAAIGALAPEGTSGFGDLVRRLGDVVVSLKVKATSLLRHLGGDSAGGSDAALGGSRGVASIGMTKGLAVVCLGTASAGGVAAQVAPLLDPWARGRPTNASASTHRVAALPASSDARLVAERLRRAVPDRDRRRLAPASVRSADPETARPARGVEPSPTIQEVDERPARHRGRSAAAPAGQRPADDDSPEPRLEPAADESQARRLRVSVSHRLAAPIRTATASAEPIRTATASVEPIRTATASVETIRTATASVEPIRTATASVEPIRTATATPPTTRTEDGIQREGCGRGIGGSCDEMEPGDAHPGANPVERCPPTSFAGA
jgi:RNA polymerase sigma factor (sigma-70 family)